MKLYLATISDVLPHHLSLLPEDRQSKAMRYKFPDDQKRCIAGGLLMRTVSGGAPIRDNGFGKPICEGFHFNLSHSGEYVALAVGEEETGCDLEQHRFTRYEKMGKHVFSENERRLLGESSDKAGVFYELWTKKEALLKCMGKGFHREARTVDVSGDIFRENGRSYYLRTKRFADYTLSLCCEAPFDYEIVFIDLDLITN